MKIIFFDIDEVAVTLRANLAAGMAKRDKVDPVVMGLLNRLMECDSETQIVISSARRIIYTKEEILTLFREGGFIGDFHQDWRTPVSKTNKRGDEVDAWLTRHPEVTRYVCIDDESDYHPYQPLVQMADQVEGMSVANFLQVSEILHGNENYWFDWKNKRLMNQQSEPQRPDSREKHCHQKDGNDCG